MQCNSCNAQFAEEGARNAHYRSDWHRYNLKRKVAALPGVTEEWFEARKAAAASALAGEAGAAAGASSRLECSLCCKQYATRSAFDNHLRSRGHVARAALAPAGTATCDPVLRQRKDRVPQEGAQKSLNGVENGRGGKGLGMKAVGPGTKTAGRVEVEGEKEDEDEEESEEEGEWEEVEDEEEAAALMDVEEQAGQDRAGASVEAAKDSSEAGVREEGEWEWECSQCLFCEARCKGSVEECVGHMHKAHGFFLPDAEYISDLPGLLTYLALKINKGLLCLFCDDRGKGFPSAEAVKAHMEAKSHAKLRYGDGSGVAEEELEEFYDFSPSYEDEDSSMQLVASGAEPASHLALQRGGTELVIKGKATDGGALSKVVGSREYARYYKQRPKPADSTSALVSAVVSRYKSMGVSTSGLRSHVDRKELAKRDTAVKASRRAEIFRSQVALANNVIRNLPRNCVF